VTRSSAPTSPPQHTALLKQVTLQRELQAVYSRLQGLWPIWDCIRSIVLEGLSPASWAEQVKMHPKEVSGVLLGSLSYLAKIYADLDPAPEPAREWRLRTWVTGRGQRWRAMTVDAPNTEFRSIGCIRGLSASKNVSWKASHRLKSAISESSVAIAVISLSPAGRECPSVLRPAIFSWSFARSACHSVTRSALVLDMIGGHLLSNSKRTTFCRVEGR
jgi:hypothetical protein